MGIDAGFDVGTVVAEMLRLILASIIMWAAVGKARAAGGFREFLRALGLSRAIARWAAPAVIGYEGLLAVGLVVLPGAVIGPIVATTFLAFAAIMARKPSAHGCHCLGAPRPKSTSTRKGVILRLAGAGAGVYLAVIASPPIDPRPQLVWQIIIMALAVRVGAGITSEPLPSADGVTVNTIRGSARSTREGKTGRREFLRRGAAYSGGMIAGTALPSMMTSPCYPECPPTHECVCSSTGQCSCQPKPLPPLSPTATPTFPPPTPTPMPVFDCARQYSGAMQECDLVLQTCLGSCDISSTEPGPQLIADSVFCLFRQSACLLEKTRCAERATRDLEQCCRIGATVFEGCAGVLDGSREGLRARRRFKRDTAPDYWAAMAHVHYAAVAVFGEDLARSWTRAHIAERLVPLLDLRRNLRDAGNTSAGPLASFVVGEATGREIQFLRAIDAVPDLRGDFATETMAVLEVVRSIAALSRSPLPPAETSRVKRQLGRIERKLVDTRSSDLPDYRNEITGTVLDADFGDVVDGVTRRVRARLASFDEGLPPSVELGAVISSLRLPIAPT